MSEKFVACGGLIVVVFYALLCVAVQLPAMTVSDRGAATQPKIGSDRAKMARGSVLVPVSLVAKIAPNKVELLGTVPDKKAHAAVVKNARARYGLDRVIDKLVVDPDVVVTEWFDNVLGWFPPRLVDLAAGELSVSGASITLLGEIGSLEEKLAVGKALASLVGPTATLHNELAIKASAGGQRAETDPTEFEKKVTAALTGHSVEFEPLSDTISAKGRSALDRLVPVLKESADIALEVTGPLDKTTAEISTRLSEERAKAIKGYLVSHGVEGRRLTPRPCDPAVTLDGCKAFRVLRGES
jgi:hypothetical protein